MDQTTATRSLSYRLLFIFGILALLFSIALAVVVFARGWPLPGGLLPFGGPTPPCGEAHLFIGASEFRFEPSPSGGKDVESAYSTKPGQVYWSAGNGSSYVAVFNPDRGNQILLVALKPGAPVAVIMEDCSAARFRVEKVEVWEAFDLSRVDPALVGIFLYLPLEASGRGLVVTARLVEYLSAADMGPVATAEPQIVPAENVPAILPTPACPSRGLALGSEDLNIESGFAPAARIFRIETGPVTGGEQIPESVPPTGLAYLLTNTPERRVFYVGLEAIGPDAAALDGLTRALVTGDDCTSTLYQLSPPQQVDLATPGLLDSLQAELSILVQAGAAQPVAGQPGYLLQGSSTGVLTIPPTPGPPAEGEVQIEVGILGVAPSSLGDMLEVSVSIYNYGTASLPVTPGDLQLDAAGQVQPPVSSSPALPIEILTGATLELSLAFNRPSEGWGVLKVFTLEYDLADFVP